MNIKEKVLETARLLFNEYGLKKVTARVICKELQISPGTFSYHFPDKDFLVKDLYHKMQEENFEVIKGIGQTAPGIRTYLETHKKMFLIQVKYKFFFLNLFEILVNYEEIKAVYLKILQQERLLAKEMIGFYQSSGILKKIKDEEIERLINVGQILNNFWTIDAEIMEVDDNKKKMVHYMKICCGLLEPYLESHSLKEYHHFFSELEKD